MTDQTQEQQPHDDHPAVTEPHEEPSLSPEERIAELQEKLRTAEKQVALIRQAHAESAAEFDKIKERLRRNHAAETERARLEMTRSLFDVADNLDRTIEGVKSGGSVEVLLEGVTAVRGQFMHTLGTFGLERFDPLGAPFDPEQHDAIGVLPVQSEDQNNTVVAVLKPGFKAGKHILRAALVQVGQYTAPPRPEAESDEPIVH
jgi:molecular chaperone GrpE